MAIITASAPTSLPPSGTASGDLSGTYPGPTIASGKVVTSLAKAGSAALKDAVTLTGGTNVTLTQAAQDISIAASGGSQPALPIAVPSVGTVDGTTYNDTTSGSGKLAVLVLSSGDVAFACAQAGDAFPRLLYVPGDGGFYLGDGTFDPYNDGGARVIFSGGVLTLSGRHSNGSIAVDATGAVFLSIPGGTFTIGDSGSANRVLASRMDGPLVLASGATAPAISGGFGAPTTTGGEVGDIYIRSNPGGANQTFYRCTVAGNPGTWAGIL